MLRVTPETYWFKRASSSFKDSPRCTGLPRSHCHQAATATTFCSAAQPKNSKAPWVRQSKKARCPKECPKKQGTGTTRSFSSFLCPKFSSVEVTPSWRLFHLLNVCRVCQSCSELPSHKQNDFYILLRWKLRWWEKLTWEQFPPKTWKETWFRTPWGPGTKMVQMNNDVKN